MKKYFLFDCETGGIDRNTSLLTLFGMILDEKLTVQDTISLKIKPDDGVYHVKAAGLKVNKINLVEHEKEATTATEAAREFENFICKHSLGETKLIPTGHNLSLDVEFCKRNFLRGDQDEGGGWDKFFSYRSLDTATLAHGLILAGKLPEDLDCSLSSLAKYFEIDYSGAHNAEFDAKLTLAILIFLIKLM